MKLRLERISDASTGHDGGGYEGGYGTQDVGGGSADGQGIGYWGSGGYENGHGYHDGTFGNHGGNGFTWSMPLPATNHSARRTERVFRCAGCVGGFECPIHGVRL